MNEPIGRFGSFRPARARRTAFERSPIASSWPMTRSCSASSIWSSRSDSSWAIRVTGMPVHMETTSAMSSSSTVGLSPADLACHSARSGIQPFSRAVASASRSVGRLLELLVGDRRFLLLGDALEVLAAPRSASAAPTSGCRRTREAASSITSIALSGRKRSGDVAVGQVRGRLQRVVGDLHLVVLLVAARGGP